MPKGKGRGGRIRVGIIFGGRSAEHDVSLISARSIIAALDPDRYEARLIGITRKGQWLAFSEADARAANGDPRRLMMGATGQSLPAGDEADNYHPQRAIIAADPTVPTQLGQAADEDVNSDLDVVFPVLHGPFGEDGTIQGLLELADLPYVGAGVMGSALGMDKGLQKTVFQQAGLSVLPYIVVIRRDWDNLDKRDQIRATIADKLGYPCFVKPVNMGSSVGISKAHDAGELDAALEHAARFDRKLIIEKAASKPREIECSVLGNDDPRASLPGEIMPHHEFYDYSAKYTEGESDLVVPADLPPALVEAIQRTAIAAFRALDCAGMTRVDFFLESDTGNLYINEVNTIPGFTPLSMYPQMWAASGLSYPELIDRLIALALERHADKQRNETQP